MIPEGARSATLQWLGPHVRGAVGCNILQHWLAAERAHHPSIRLEDVRLSQLAHAAARPQLAPIAPSDDFRSCNRAANMARCAGLPQYG